MQRFNKKLHKDVATIVLGACFGAAGLFWALNNFAGGAASESVSVWLLGLIGLAFAVNLYLCRHVAVHHMRRTWFFWVSVLLVSGVVALIVGVRESPFSGEAPLSVLRYSCLSFTGVA
ncbi:hypothetical protein E1162_04865 [Rhodobacteraceae bacterium RKSG542]|uniref:hypothetical protein n=1 Tax=Pseudovibrio flavus TaxID=2529854 RepID=UPI0012BC459A|nr:hypothetical protein [Pseudovibrio flavus]MTI16569.1 hypothetical protein [Pseudovibrio flavus]